MILLCHDDIGTTAFPNANLAQFLGITDMSATKKTYEYERFVAWSALPSPRRNPKTQKELAKELGIDASTLSDWRRDPEFEGRTRQLVVSSCAENLPDVLGALVQGAISQERGSHRDRKLYLDWVEKFITTKDGQSDEISKTQAMIRYIIERNKRNP